MFKTPEVITAYIRAKQKFEPFTKDTQGYGYKYATLDTVLNAVEPALLAEGFILSCTFTHATNPALYEVTQEIRYANKTAKGIDYTDGLDRKQVKQPLVCIKLTLTHLLGEAVESRLEFPVVDDPQEMGKRFTYYHRYLLCKLLNLTADEDTDAAPVNNNTTNKGWSR